MKLGVRTNVRVQFGVANMLNWFDLTGPRIGVYRPVFRSMFNLISCLSSIRGYEGSPYKNQENSLLRVAPPFFTAPGVSESDLQKEMILFPKFLIGNVKNFHKAGMQWKPGLVPADCKNVKCSRNIPKRVSAVMLLTYCKPCSNLATQSFFENSLQFCKISTSCNFSCHNQIVVMHHN
jgi:hypothetical protein